jgi:hypothetical protein
MPNDFCPLIKEQCKRQGCMFWVGKSADERVEKEGCSLNLFAQALSQAIESALESEALESKKETIQLKETEEELASELSAFIRKEFPEQESEHFLPHKATRLFWLQKGVDPNIFALDTAARLKMEKAEMLALERMNKERFQKEKEMLPELTEKCIQWARKQGLKKVTKSNLSFFLSENELKVSQMTKDILYNKVNLELEKNREK